MGKWPPKKGKTPPQKKQNATKKEQLHGCATAPCDSSSNSPTLWEGLGIGSYLSFGKDGVNLFTINFLPFVTYVPTGSCFTSVPTALPSSV